MHLLLIYNDDNQIIMIKIILFCKDGSDRSQWTTRVNQLIYFSVFKPAKSSSVLLAAPHILFIQPTLGNLHIVSICWVSIMDTLKWFSIAAIFNAASTVDTFLANGALCYYSISWGCYEPSLYGVSKSTTSKFVKHNEGDFANLKLTLNWNLLKLYIQLCKKYAPWRSQIAWSLQDCSFLPSSCNA